MWVSRGSGSESIAFSNETFSNVGEVGRQVRHVILGDVVF